MCWHQGIEEITAEERSAMGWQDLVRGIRSNWMQRWVCAAKAVQVRPMRWADHLLLAVGRAQAGQVRHAIAIAAHGK